MDALKRLEKLQGDTARAEELLFGFAKDKGLSEFMDKWDNKLYADQDYTICHMVSDFLKSVEKENDFKNE